MNGPEARSRRAEQALLAAAALAGLALLLWIGRLLGVGFEFSDDGYYLNLNRNPGLYSYSVTQFGFIYNPLFRAVGWDVALFRQAGLLLTSGLAAVVGALIARRAGASWLVAGQMGLVLAPLSLTLFYMWLPTPGYNGLGFQGLLIVAIALLMLEGQGRWIWLAWVVLGVGGWVVFMAKPTSATLLGPLVFAYLLAARRLNLWGALIAAAVAACLLAGAAIAIDGSVGGFVHRLSMGAEFAAVLEGGHTIFGILRLDRFSLSPQEFLILGANTALIALATFCAGAASAGLRFAGLGIAATYVLVTIGVAAGWIVPSFGFGTYFVLQIWAAPLGALAGSIIPPGRGTRPTVSAMLLAALFALFPHILSFGTNNNYWANGAMAGLFWVLAGLVLVAFDRGAAGRHALLPSAAGALGIVAVLMVGATQQPYRQTQPLRLQQTAAVVGPAARALPMSHDFAAYVGNLHELADRAGFVAGTPMIDLTGHYPGALFALDAQAIGQAWTIGGYRGSDQLARAALAPVPCNSIASAWLLREPDGERALSQFALLPSGLVFEDVGSIMSPTGTYRQSYRQWLSRPVGDLQQRIDVCEQARREGPGRDD